MLHKIVSDAKLKSSLFKEVDFIKILLRSSQGRVFGQGEKDRKV